MNTKVRKILGQLRLDSNFGKKLLKQMLHPKKLSRYAAGVKIHTLIRPKAEYYNIPLSEIRKMGWQNIIPEDRDENVIKAMKPGTFD